MFVRIAIDGFSEGQLVNLPQRLICLGILVVGSGCGGGESPAEPEAATPVAPAERPSTSKSEKPDGSSQTRSVEELRVELGANEKAEFVERGGQIVAVNLYDSGVTDLAPLKGLPLRELDLRGLQVSDLSPLAGMPLEALFAEETQVSDLSPLKGLPLTKLYLSATPVKDLSALEGMSLRELNLVGTSLESLSSLPDTSIGTLWLVDTKVKDLSPLANRSITSLDIQGTLVEDLSPLATMSSLQRLNIIDTPITDLSPLSRLALQRILLTPETIKTGWGVLRDMSSLQVIDTLPLHVIQAENRRPLTAAQFWESHPKLLP
ncbi:leucine-rich repeat domain-containing protein [Thalassoroseus pseudoceratinae]|uniref:leucine-rich repeat domain-containing protein n=1 Tax=Thalassoroseus pseudoceratinae TaxID=2713176 RepID=UPI00197CCDC9|nr:hypothetical protein [Thalassoroseus pseudoceratinae]